MKLRNAFVEFIPDELEAGVLYVSMKYRTTTHLCPCGCGNEVPLPISKTQWKLTFNGEVSLDPSVGNWNFPCRSHYFIRNGAVLWAGDMSDAAIKRGRVHAEEQRMQHYEDRAGGRAIDAKPIVQPEEATPQTHGIWTRLKNWFTGTGNE
ncbi:DUF6527 family protein [Pseudomonas sp. NBRC 111127]|uniref:DUF6527 family protein n=1 Tax=Pseudomonas sp. NBRC 111127 TaxID=1661042 RepID=UPI0006D44215|nr:DUF6527 family protein [Pseudomonas sp. NBRC 111127]